MRVAAAYYQVPVTLWEMKRERNVKLQSKSAIKGSIDLQKLKFPFLYKGDPIENLSLSGKNWIQKTR